MRREAPVREVANAGDPQTLSRDFLFFSWKIKSLEHPGDVAIRPSGFMTSLSFISAALQPAWCGGGGGSWNPAFCT